MALTERGSNFYKRTIGSEGFERFSRKPIGIASAVVLLALGLGSVEGLIQAINQEMIKTAILYGAQAGLELGTAGAIGVANVKSRIRQRGNKPT